MAVTGWTDYSQRPWTESGGDIYCENGSSHTLGILTKDDKEDIGDFEFEVDIETISYGAGDKGGLYFCVQDGNETSQNYLITWTVEIWTSKYGASATQFYFSKNSINGKNNAGAQISTAYVNSTSKTFTLKLVKSGSDFELYYDGTKVDSLAGTNDWSATDTTYSSGHIGFGYPGSVWSGTDTKFSNITITDTGGGSTRRIFIIS